MTALPKRHPTRHTAHAAMTLPTTAPRRIGPSGARDSSDKPLAAVGYVLGCPALDADLHFRSVSAETCTTLKPGHDDPAAGALHIAKRRTRRLLLLRQH
jgi:hypothetical protein